RRVGAGLGEYGLALLGHQRLVLVTAQDHVDVGGGRERAVGAHVLVRDGDDEVRAAPAQIGGDGGARGRGVAEVDVGTARRRRRRLRRREAEQADVETAAR